MSDDYRRLEPSRAELQAWLDAVASFSLDRIETVAATPTSGTVGAAGNQIARGVSVPIPEEPLPGGMDAALSVLGRALQASLNTMGPGFLAYIPGGGIPTAALADLASDCFNRFTGYAAAAPGLVRLESDVLAWLAGEVGYGPDSRGLLTSGGTLANLSAVAAAREDKLPEGSDLRLARAYVSEQAHASVNDCLRLAGFPRSSIVTVPVDSDYRLDIRALAPALAADRAQGLTPFLVVGSAGTTNTGAIDPLPELADLCSRERLWFHVDGAYGGAFVLCPEGKTLLGGIERADSVSLDPHKGMFLPYGTGCLLVKEGRTLRRAHSSQADYLRDFQDRDEAGPCPAEHGPELSRDFRGLRLWLPLMLHGAGAFRSALSEKLNIAAVIREGLHAHQAAGAAMEVVCASTLSVDAFRLQRRDGEALEGWNARNTALLEAINAGGKVFLSGTWLPVADGEAYTLRTCVLSFRTHAQQADDFLSELRRLVPLS